MKNTQLINQIKTRMQEMQNMISNWKQQINTYESTLLALAQKLEEIKQITNNQQNIMKNNKNIQNKINSLNGSDNNK